MAQALIVKASVANQLRLSARRAFCFSVPDWIWLPLRPYHKLSRHLLRLFGTFPVCEQYGWLPLSSVITPLAESCRNILCVASHRPFASRCLTGSGCLYHQLSRHLLSLIGTSLCLSSMGPKHLLSRHLSLTSCVSVLA